MTVQNDRECEAPGIVQVADYGEGAEVFDKAARQLMGMSGAEFLKRWDAGEFADESAFPKAGELAMMISFVRPVPVDAGS